MLFYSTTVLLLNIFKVLFPFLKFAILFSYDSWIEKFIVTLDTSRVPAQVEKNFYAYSKLVVYV